ncbi:permease prefix domain 1-containing protein [Actinoallomurus sp. NPDC052308]|uniref:permease prefix domain 1-containing protein n=1 Tax=Actinoallomurus sp. NPDC052308 TaxID=3155530 RepID=UPI00344A598C
MTGPSGLSGASDQVIGCYLTEVSARLIGPAKARRDILAELGAGLADAADAHHSRGLEPARAARAAIAEFGGPDRVADGFRAELTAAQARRTVLALMTTGPLISALWTGAAAAGGIGVRPAPPWQWAGVSTGARPAIQLIMIALAIGVAGALFTVATTGRLARPLPAGPHASAAVAAGGTAAIDTGLLIVLAVQAAGAPGLLTALPAAAAATASLIRLTLAVRAARTCLRLKP